MRVNFNVKLKVNVTINVKANVNVEVNVKVNVSVNVIIKAKKQLQFARIDEPQREARLLLSYVTGLSMSKIFSNPDKDV